MSSFRSLMSLVNRSPGRSSDRRRRSRDTRQIKRRAFLEQLEGRRLLASDVFINELHYDNTGNDVGEFVEIAGPAGTDLAGWSIEFYNGSGGAVYDTEALTGVIPDEGAGGGALSFFIAGIQNGPDALALIDASNTVREFISYEGSFAATDGAAFAAGLTSVDIGVSEPGSTAVGDSLQRTGSGSINDDFTWTGPTAQSPGTLNAGQTFGSMGPALPDIFISEILFNPPGTDEPNEYIELRGPSGATIPSDTYFIDVDGDVSSGASLGDVTSIIDLSGLTFGSNGYLLLLQQNSPYAASVDPLATTVISTAAGFSGLPDNRYQGDNIAGGGVQTGIENPTNTFFVLRSTVAPTLTGPTGDADSNDDGVFDNPDWEIIDGISIVDNDAGDTAYADVVFTQQSGSAVAEYVGRIGESTGQSQADWVAAAVSGDAIGGWTLETGNTLPVSFEGEALDHFGSENFAVPTSTGGIVINEFQADPDAALGDANGDGTANFSEDEFVELVNDSASPLDISSWSISDGFGTRHVFPTGTFVAPGQAVVVFGGGTLGTYGNALAFTATDGQLGLNNGGDTITVADASGTTRASVAYGDEGGANTALTRSPDLTGDFVQYSSLGDGSILFSPGFEVDGVTPFPGAVAVPVLITPTDGSNDVTEDGGTDTVDIVLTEQPDSDVTFTFGSINNQASASPTSVVFTNGNWDVPQTITVSATDDSDIEGPHNGSISVTTASDDADFAALPINNIVVSITDNDFLTPGGTFAINELRVSHATNDDVSNNFIELVETSGASAATTGGITLVVLQGAAFGNDLPGDIVRIFDLTGGSSDGDGFVLIHDDGSTATLDAGDIEITNFDLPGAPWTYAIVTEFTGFLGQSLDTNGDGALDVTPWNTVMDAVSIDALGGGATLFAGSLGGTNVTSNDEDVPPAIARTPDVTGQFLVRPFDDDTIDTPGFTNILPANVRVTSSQTNLQERRTADIFGNVGVTDGSVSVSLDAEPASDVTITLAADPNDPQLTANGAASTTLTFTANNWFTPQTVVIEAIDDSADEGDHPGLLTITASSADSDYNNIEVTDPGFNIIDNDAVQHVVVINEVQFDPGTVDDANGDGTADSVQDEFVEVLNTGDEPFDISGWTISDAVGVRHEFAAGTILASGQAIVVFAGGTLGSYGNSLSALASTGTLDLTNGGDTVSLREGALTVDELFFAEGPLNESQARDEVPGSIGTFLGTDSFNEGFLSTPGLTNVSGDLFTLGASAFITQTDGSTDVAEEQTTSDTFDFVLGAQPDSNVTVAIATDGETLVSPSSLTFTPANWDVPVTVTVTAVDDADLEGNHTSEISFSLTSDDLDDGYDGLAVPPIFASVRDNDVPLSTNAVINEFVADHTGADSEAFIEVLAVGSTGPVDLSGLTLLVIDGTEANGDGTIGVIEGAIEVGTTEANGLAVVDFDSSNDTVTYLLVTGFTGAVGDDIDDDNDGAFNTTVPWTSVVDSVTTLENGAGQVAYSTVVLTSALDDNPFAFGGASRIPNGVDTDTVADWVRNDFGGAGFAAFPNATAEPDEAINTPGAVNAVPGPEAGVTLDLADGLAVDEEGPTSDTFTVVLDAQPDADVTITLGTADGETTVDLSPLTFTAANWDTPQTVTVTAVDDPDIEDAHTGVITFIIASDDASYGQLTIADQTVSITDNDGAAPPPMVELIVPSITKITDLDTGTLDLTVTFDTVMNTTVDPTFTFPVEDPSASVTVASGVWTDPQTYVASFALITSDVFVPNVDVEISGAQDISGNALASFTQTNVFAIDTVGTIIAADLLNSGSVGLNSFTDDPLAGTFTPGDGFQKYTIGVDTGIPFTLVDESQFGFAGDSLGAVREANTQTFFGAVDTINSVATGPVTASWEFDISSSNNLALSIDFAAMGDFEASDAYTVSYSIDGGASIVAFDLLVNEDGSVDYTLGDGSVVTLNDPMQIGGVDVTNELQTFETSIAGTGSVLTLSVEAALDGGSEAVAIQNILVKGDAASDTTPPTITGVFASSSTWNAGFLDIVDGTSDNGLGVPLAGADQLRTLPWLSGIDTIAIEFSEDVSAAFTEANLALVGVNDTDYEPFASVSYDSATNVGTITLSAAVTNDKLLLVAFDSLTDAAGNALDGEWTDATSTVSGNGTAGGQFNFRLDVLAGDVNGSGDVNVTGDVLGLFAQNGLVPATALEAYFDVNATGDVNVTGDLLGTFALNGDSLPDGDPSLPSSGDSGESNDDSGKGGIDDFMTLLGNSSSFDDLI